MPKGYVKIEISSCAAAHHQNNSSGQSAASSSQPDDTPPPATPPACGNSHQPPRRATPAHSVGLERLDIPAPFVHICKEIYSGSTQQVRSASKCTGHTPLRVGIKQGCPLSPFLYNIALEALLPALDELLSGYSLQNGTCVRQLAYA